MGNGSWLIRLSDRYDIPTRLLQPNQFRFLLCSSATDRTPLFVRAPNDPARDERVVCTNAAVGVPLRALFAFAPATARWQNVR
jgi:hypothetical protein